ncbi:MAG TPA: tRNA-specific adenosine deaminase [Desulfobulbaceae bacterium]|nr:tRNA-specific adenosine deaminase [Desulfobulbaceae bacterium]
MKARAHGHEYFMDIALDEAVAALARGEFPVGCVIVCKNKVVASGGRRDSGGNAPELEHAEIVALRRLLRETSGFDPSDMTVYSTMEPCLMCLGTLIVNGFRQIVYAYEDVMGGASDLPLSDLRPLYKNIRLEITGGVRRQQSLALFQRFFAARPAYLRDSLLARYTIAQQ